jgi:hypothetical protein
VKVVRRPGFDAPLQFSLENLPPGIVLEESEITDAGKQVRLRLRAAESAIPARISDLVIAAEGVLGGRRYTEAAPKIALQLD